MEVLVTLAGVLGRQTPNHAQFNNRKNSTDKELALRIVMSPKEGGVEYAKGSWEA